MKTVRLIIIDYLKENGYDGLCGEDCGCGIDDPFVCGEINEDCNAAYEHKKPDCNNCDVIDCETRYTIYEDGPVEKCYKTERQKNSRKAINGQT